MTVDPTAVGENIAAIRQRLDAERRDIDLVAVTKGFGPDSIVAAVEAGATRIGENYAQELLAKRAELELHGSVAFHFIGRLQSNKVRSLAAAVDVWESVDRESVLVEIARRAPGATVVIQVNATGEADKGGCEPSAAASLVERGLDLNLNVDGMMTVGPTNRDRAETARCFATVRSLVDSAGLGTCSMGMSHDLDVALEHGTTRVRIGTALFGTRPGTVSRATANGSGTGDVHGGRRRIG